MCWRSVELYWPFLGTNFRQYWVCWGCCWWKCFFLAPSDFLSIPQVGYTVLNSSERSEFLAFRLRRQNSIEVNYVAKERIFSLVFDMWDRNVNKTRSSKCVSQTGEERWRRRSKAVGKTYQCCHGSSVYTDFHIFCSKQFWIRIKMEN